MKIEQCQVGHVPPTTISSPAQPSRETLWDGTRITVRDLDPEDFPAVMALADNLSGDELYLRFFTYHPRLVAEWAHSVTKPAVGNVAVGAFDGKSLLAVGNSVAVDDSGAAEISVVVAHRNHPRGIATALRRRLAEPAKSTGRQRLIAEVDRAYARSTGLAEPEPTASLSATCTAR